MYCCGMLAELLLVDHISLVIPHCPIIHPSAVVPGVKLPNREMTRFIKIAGQTSQVVSSSGDVGMGLNEVGISVCGANDSDVGFCVIQGPIAGIVTLMRLRYIP
jgi:hypothetical protein